MSDQELIEAPTARDLQVTRAGPLVPTTPDTLLELAVRHGADVSQLERLMALKERYDANEARKAFTDGMSLVKAEPLDIFKRKSVGYETKDGDFVGYMHAELSDVADAVVPALARHGFSHRWEIRQDAGRIHVSCIVTHRSGHCETVTLDAAPDDSGKKNKIQQVASAVTYLQRYTLLSVIGLAAKSVQHDDDGAGAGDAQEESQVMTDLLAKLGDISRDDDALKFWQDNRHLFKSKQDDYDRFKSAVAAHRRRLGNPK